MKSVLWLSLVMVFGLLFSVLSPQSCVLRNASSVLTSTAWADDSTLTGIQKPTPGSMGLTVTVADGVAVTTPTQAGATFFKLTTGIDTAYALRTAVNPYIRHADTIFSDTIDLTAANTGQFPTTDTTRKMQRGETATFVLALANAGNSTDSIGLVVDSAIVDGYTGLDTMPNWSISFYDSRATRIGTIFTRSRDTFFMRLAAGKSETLTVKAYADSSAFETSTIRFTLRTYVGNGNPRQFAVKAYRGLNGDTYGGDGHDSITFFVTLKAPSALRVSRADTAFAPLSLGNGVSDAILSDTQHFIPGAMLVRTIWFDNDDTAAVDTQVVIEDWIDTRFLKFDTAGVRGLASPQVSVARAFVDSNYGNIFTDSAMPRNVTGAAQFDVRVQYYTSTGLAPLSASTNPDSVGRLRWTITKRAGVGSLVGGNYNDAQGSIDPAPTALGAAADSDMGYVRYAVIIRADSSAAKGPGRPDSNQVVGADPAASGFDSAYIEPDSSAAARTTFVSPFTAEFLPNVDIVPETSFAQKIQQSGGDTFYFPHRIGNHGNGADSIVLSGTTTIDALGARVVFFSDIGNVGSFDGIEPRIDALLLNGTMADTKDILVAVFVPAGYANSDSAFIKARSTRNAAFYDTTTDVFKVVATPQVVPDTAVPILVGKGDSLTFTVFLNVPPTQDSVTITLDSPPLVAPVTDSTTVFIDTQGRARTTDSTVTVKYDSTTGQLTITFLDTPKSDTYVWQIGVQNVESGVIRSTFTETGMFVIDTIAPFFTDTTPARLFSVDTILTGSETAVSIRILDTAVGDTNTGLDSLVITVRDTAGKIVSVDTIDALAVYTFPFDTSGAYTVQVIAIDFARNTSAMSDSLQVQVPVKRTIDLIAEDKDGVKQTDDIAKGLSAQGAVKVTDISVAANLSIMVTITSDVDPVGIRVELFRTDATKGVFDGSLGFTNGVSSDAAKKIKVRDGSQITATYDADGTVGPIVAIADQITWQGKKVEGLDKVRSWPNPAVGPDVEIVIQDLPSDPTMTIEIYNLNAEKLYTMRVGAGIDFSANQNIAHWNGRNLRGQLVASGTYVYMVRSKVGTKVGKMTIVH